ncbi:hypothetical protein POM88_049285 [Heracleum sosnowskyi]|uniref:CRAL-TRIO domain-containing protein n=2 Tax=Heracleum sosnowskyi TaxID=360622 RepID=A0AAD8M196_9APIA|nr:hypothetical protein POM88_049285 [Heracleum sosnowskyi]
MNCLATLDIFAGCGGLSEGLQQSGVCTTKWAIEYEEAAGDAFKLNHPESLMFINNYNVILKAIMDKTGDSDDCISTPEAAELAAKLNEEEIKNLPLPGQGFVEFGCYFHRQPDLGWMRKLQQILGRKLQRNLHAIYVLHPTFGLKAAIFALQLFVDGVVWKKVVYVDRLLQLFKYVPREQHTIPDFVFQHDLEVNGGKGLMVDPRTKINVKDPYKRLGISKEASEDEIQGARNFLVQRYIGHKPSIDAIESAHDKIIMQQFYDRKNPKINIKKKVREVTQSKVMLAITSRFRTPSSNFIVKTSIAFVILGALTVLFPTEEGPTLQVAISLIATMYFIHDRLKNKLRAFLYGAGTFILSWLVGTFLMVSVIPPIIKGRRSLEVTTSLISYVLLWVSSTYLR